MANAERDENNVSTLLGVLNTTGTSVVPVTVVAATNSLSTSITTSGTDFGPSNALRDENSVPTLMGVNSSDGVTPVVVYATSGGSLLIKSI